jgi:hypothetical protein
MREEKGGGAPKLPYRQLMAWKEFERAVDLRKNKEKGKRGEERRRNAA